MVGLRNICINTLHKGDDDDDDDDDNNNNNNNNQSETRDSSQLSEQVREIITTPNPTQRKQAFCCTRAFVLRGHGAPVAHEPHSASHLLWAYAVRIVAVTAPRNFFKASSVKHAGSIVYSVLPPSLLAADLGTQTCRGAEVVDVIAELSCRFCLPHHTRGAYPSFLATDTQTFCWSHAAM